MSKNLVIVESPTKTKAIEKYLGSDYKVVSSKGHIRDLATSGKFGFGVDLENHFEPNYVAIKGKKKDITALKKDAEKAKMVYLATDPDREGEAISWHLKDALQLKDEEYERVVFNEITKNVVKDAFNHTRKIDDDLVHSQETRRILDRIIGFRLSKLMQSKTGGKSAGRVQSVALKLIVDREREIESFKEEEYWTVTAKFTDMEASLDTVDGKKADLKTEEETDKVIDGLDSKFVISNYETKSKKKASKYPFITSTMQQEAISKLGFSSKKTMQVAQKLYEGIDIENDTIGLITYMRTDSVRLSDEFIKSSYAYIRDSYGEEYIGHVKKSKKRENVQDAHEAIRPSSINRTPDSIKKYLTKDEFKLYEMIYARALASLMADAKLNQTTITLDNNNTTFKTTGSVLVFEGYLKVYGKFESSEDKVLPKLKVNDELIADEIVKDQHFTKPPARYTEAKLIKAMEELGIGRPSTYASTISTLTQRGYVKIIEKKLNPTEVGITTTDKLQEFFSDLINVKYTAAMETDLDTIALGKLDEIKVLREFYDKFEPEVEKAFVQIEKKAPKETGEVCPNCGSSLVIRKGRYGEFTACSNYPECKYIKKEEKQVKEIMDCPKCGGKIIEKKTKRGKIFYGCNNYPKCKYASWDKPTGNLCKECGEPLVEKNGSETCPNCNK